MDRERRAGGREGRELLRLGHRRGAAGHAGEHHALRHLGHGQLAPSAAAAAANAGTPGVSV